MNMVLQPCGVHTWRRYTELYKSLPVQSNKVKNNVLNKRSEVLRMHRHSGLQLYDCQFVQRSSLYQLHCTRQPTLCMILCFKYFCQELNLFCRNSLDPFTHGFMQRIRWACWLFTEDHLFCFREACSLHAFLTHALLLRFSSL